MGHGLDTDRVRFRGRVQCFSPSIVILGEAWTDSVSLRLALALRGRLIQEQGRTELGRSTGFRLRERPLRMPFGIAQSGL